MSSYVLKMKSYIDNLERLSHPVSLNLATMNELHAMLKLHEQTLLKKYVAPALHSIQAGRVQKKNHKNKKLQLAARGNNQGKGKTKLAYAPKPKIPLPPKKDNPAKDAICHQCSDVGYYTDCGTNICNTTHGLMGSRKLNPGALNLNKRANIKSTLLWHCRLGHISKKCIVMLQHDGLFNSADIHSFDKCVLCMSSKMARKPYSHQVGRAKDLLRLIHADVCGPFRTVSKQGASYFVTFTDDFSRYGYVYLLKHKHKVFETFKLFQKEVENQLKKNIKLLPSDRKGEYMSQEFLDHLKEHRIIAHRTPPYTPQHNDVSERRNRTLVVMVRSMMSQTTLLKSFWDYTLESATRILNMVPTNKVEKTPYKVCGTMAIRISRRSNTYDARNNRLTSRYLFLPYSDFGFRITDLEQSKNETDQMIVLEWLFLTIAPCDAAEPWQLGSQDAATPMMQGIIDLHHDIFFFLILILVFVSRILVRALWHFQKDKNPIPQMIVHGTTIEILWTIFPSIIPMFIAIPSFALLYSMDEVVVNPAITIKAIGHQWYRSAPLHEGDLSATKCLKNMVREASGLPPVPSCCCWRYTSLFSVWSDIREIDAQPEMSDNGAEVVNLSAP
nr:cytochrome oxidase subunit 2, mitochondrial [Tanacetum cinerariifolium]